MINYKEGGAFGIHVLLRLHGSAAFKAVPLSFLSTIFFVGLTYFLSWLEEKARRGREGILQIEDDGNDGILLLYHPYPIAACVAAFTFLLSFKASFSYNRYWEACTAIQQMQSKWLDIGMELAAFHLQSKRFKNLKPPAFGSYPQINSIIRERQRLNVFTKSDLEEKLNQLELEEEQLNSPTNTGDEGATTGGGRKFYFWKKKKNRSTNNNYSSRNGQLRKRRSNSRSGSSSSIVENVGVGHTSNNSYTSSSGRYKSINAPPPIATSSPQEPPKQQSSSPIRLSKRFNPLYHMMKKQQQKSQQQEMGGSTSSSLSWAQVVAGSSPSSRSTKPAPNSSSSRPPILQQQTSMHSQSVITSVPVDQIGISGGGGDNHSGATNGGANGSGGGARNGLDPYQSSLFLQETAHLLSLLSAVAFATLRNDMEHVESPLCTFYPNAQWPAEDPDSIHADIKYDYKDIYMGRSGNTSTSSTTIKPILYLLGYTRNRKSRTLYNAARPFRVIGGVSDMEISYLQNARGPLAKVALCTMWLNEFISREYLAGSTGNVAPPIISRLYQYTSDGMIGYNQARKVAYIPFPFPHAQITSIFVLVVVIFMIPLLIYSFVANLVVGCIINFVTVLCFAGLHEVSRELENPFKNVPNDIPLNNLQAQYNEALMVMFTGYHPDSYWQVEEKPTIHGPILPPEDIVLSSAAAASTRTMLTHDEEPPPLSDGMSDDINGIIHDSTTQIGTDSTADGGGDGAAAAAATSTTAAAAATANGATTTTMSTILSAIEDEAKENIAAA